jgi:hypothetical protein
MQLQKGQLVSRGTWTHRNSTVILLVDYGLPPEARAETKFEVGLNRLGNVGRGKFTAAGVT